MDWLDEIEQKWKAAKPLPPFIKPNDKVDLVQLHANAVFANDSLAMVAKLIAAVRVAEKALEWYAYQEDGRRIAEQALAQLQSGEFGNEP